MRKLDAAFYSPWLKTGMATRKVECGNHFGHTQQFLSNAKCTVMLILQRADSMYCIGFQRYSLLQS